jgi:hypothetical protein
MVYEDWLSPNAESPKAESRSSLCYDSCQSSKLKEPNGGHGTHVDFERRTGAASPISNRFVDMGIVGSLRRFVRRCHCEYEGEETEQDSQSVCLGLPSRLLSRTHGVSSYPVTQA